MCIFYNHTLDNFYVIDIILSFIWGIVDLIKFVYLIYSYRSLTIEVIILKYNFYNFI